MNPNTTKLVCFGKDHHGRKSGKIRSNPLGIFARYSSIINRPVKPINLDRCRPRQNAVCNVREKRSNSG
jgi:hypothetical protein